jgi:DUF4097 and DUF4098 domain-containing protein YvlB
MLLHMLLLGVLAPGTDTIVTVRPGSRLELSNQDGTITVATWSRNAVRVEADHDEDTRVSVDVAGGRVTVEARGDRGPAEVDYRLTVPADMSLDLSSQSGDVQIEGTRGEVDVQSVEGDISLRGGSGYVSLQSVNGDIDVSDVSGRIELTTVDGAIGVRSAMGELRAEAVDGEIRLVDVEADQVEATTVDGDITFDGTIRDGGRYRLSSHDGGVTVTAPAISAQVTISTFSGDFESDFPVTLSGGTTRKRMSFTLGSGSARLELESFDGTVALRKAGRSRGQ